MLLGIIILSMGAIFVYSYNSIILSKEEIKNNKAQIHVQLDRRGKVFDSLINTVNKAMNYEKNVLTDIIELRTKIAKLSGDSIKDKDKQLLEEELSEKIKSGELNSAINITMEAYPELKANDNLLVLQEEIVSTENKLSYAKQAYNGSVEKYIAKINSIPGVWIVSLFKNLKESFSYWTLSEDKVIEAEDRRVRF